MLYAVELTALKLEQAIAIAEIIIAAVGLVFVIVGWIIPYRQSIKLDKRNRNAELMQTQREMKIARIDEQLSKYYGPILAILQEQEIIWTRVHEQMGGGPVFELGQNSLADLESNKRKLWVHYVDTYKIPLQREIVNIMRENAHLAETDVTQTAPYEFLSYVVGWELLDKQKRDGVPNYYEYREAVNYPANFNSYIRSTFKKLIALLTHVVFTKASRLASILNGLGLCAQYSGFLF